MIHERLKLRIGKIIHGYGHNELTDMSIEDFEDLPHITAEEAGEFDSLVILPTHEMHDSGYACMDFIPCRGNKPLGRLSGYSDALHIDGIGGFGANWLDKFGTVPKTIPPVGWSIDCLPESKLLRLFCHGPLRAGDPLSSFEIFSPNRS